MTTENTTTTETTKTETTNSNSTKPTDKTWGKKAKKGAAQIAGDVVLNAVGLFGAGLMVSMGAATGLGAMAKFGGMAAKGATAPNTNE